MKKIMLSAAVLGMLVGGVAGAETILAPGSMWEYTFAAPGANWAGTTGGWATGPAPFGNNTGGYPTDPAGQFDYKTYWPADGSDGYDLYVRTTIDLTGFDLSTVTWGLGVDNGFVLLANSSTIAMANAEGYTSRWEYSGGFGSALHSGTNIIALALEDRGGLTAFDMQITGDRSAPVPEPGTMLLLGSGLLGLARVARRKS